MAEIAQISRRRTAGFLNWPGFSTPATLDITGLLPIRRMLLSLTSTITVADPGGGAAGTASTDQPHQIIGPITVEENGGTTIHKTRGDLLADLYNVLYGVRPVGATYAGTAAAPLSVAAQYEIPFSLPRKYAQGPDDSVYIANGKRVLLTATYGGATTAGAGGGGVFMADHTMTDTFLTGQARVLVDEVEGMDVSPSAGNPSPRIRATTFQSFNFYTQASISTSTALQQRLNAGQSYRMLLIKTMVSPTAGNTSLNPNASVLNGLTIQTGLGNIVDAKRADLQQLITGYVQLLSSGVPRVGLYLWDFQGGTGQSSDGFDSSRAGDFYAIMDVTAQSNRNDVIVGWLSQLPNGM